jgi:hypothetical protein
MILTEEEAKTKRCQESFGFPTQPAFPSHCIGSACMAWRWKWFVTGGQPDGSVTHHHTLASNGDKLGYCGKAGQP